MTEYRNLIFFGIAGIIGFVAVSYISSVLFFFLSKYPVSEAYPWSIWSHLQYAAYPEIQSRLFLTIGFPFLGAVALIAKIYSAINEESHADARWATRKDIEKAGLYKKHGIILGRYKGEYLISDTNTHVLCVAPTRSGKGTGVVIPNLLTWPGSIVCLDIKQENYQKTAGYRKSRGHQVFMFSPLSPDGKSHCFNPFDALSKDPAKRISDLEKMGKILIKDPVKDDPHWVVEGRALFTGLALYVLDNADMPSTIGSIYRLLGTEQELGDIIRHIVKTHKELDESSAAILLNFANKAEKERSGVKSAMSQAIQLWKSPEIDAITSKSDFSFKDLRRRPISIYVGVATGNLPTVAPLLSLFFDQLMTTLTLKLPEEDETYKVLTLLDEFHMLGRMETVANIFTLAGGYNCRVMAIVQGLGWIDDVYGQQKRNGILSVCAHRIFFAANDLETARYVSEMCGEQTIKSVSLSQNGNKGFLSSPTKNISERTYPLISKDKVTRLPENKEIILVEASFPVKCDKIKYHKGQDNNVFSSFILPAPAIPDITITRIAAPKFNIKNPDPLPRPIDAPDKNQIPLTFEDVSEDVDKPRPDGNRLALLLQQEDDD